MQVLPDLHKRTERINETIRKVNSRRQSPTQIALIDSIIQNAKVLTEYEARGLAFTPSPHSILSKYSLLREQITVQQIARDLNKLKQLTSTQSSDTCIAEARKLMSRISAAKRTVAGRSELVQFEKRLQKFLRSRRNNRNDLVPVADTNERETKISQAPRANDKSAGLRKSWRQMLQSFGISRADFQDMRRSLASIDGWEPNELDIVWELLHTLERQESQAGKPNFRLLRMIYQSMAILACETQKPYLEFLVESNRMLLLSYKQRGNVNRVQLLTVGKDNCPACQKYNREIMSLEQALKRMPIPCQHCPFKAGQNRKPSFTCTYVASM
jgi:hypothetical protein